MNINHILTVYYQPMVGFTGLQSTKQWLRCYAHPCEAQLEALQKEQQEGTAILAEQMKI